MPQRRDMDGSSSSSRRIAVIAVCAMLVMTVFAVEASEPDSVLAGHATGNGNCWQYSQPLLCKTTYDCNQVPPYLNLNCPTQELRVRLVDYFSDAYSGWRTGMLRAKTNWDVFSGPQSLSESDRADDTYVYLYDSVTGSNGLTSSSFGLTYNCNSSSWCTPTATPMDIYFSRIYFNRDKMNSWFIGDDDRANVFAHEIGHTFGLYHHSSTAALMYPYQQEDIEGPKYPYEWGNTPVCGSMSTFGMRCIYDIGGTPP